MNCRRLRLIAAVLFVLISALCFADAKPGKQSIPLNSGWEFRQHVETPAASAAVWRPAEVPGVVHTDLLKNKLIPDPFYRENEAKLQWIENAGWEYRSTFQVAPDVLTHGNVDMVFDGLDGHAELYLNDKLILTADNAFRQWRVDVKPLLKAGANQLMVYFPAPVKQAKKAAANDPWRMRIQTDEKTYIRKPAYEFGWDWGPRFVTSGIWRPVRLEIWDEARVSDFNVAQPDVTADLAHLNAEVEVVSTVAKQAKLTVEYTNRGKKGEINQNVELHPGTNQFMVPINIAKPELWFPVGYGAQSLYTFNLELKVGGRIADVAAKRTGLRKVVLRRDVDQWGRSFELVINGIPVFGKGANVIPFDSFPNRVTTAEYKRILQSARDANMNMVRHWGGGYYETDEFYDLCDELGILVWQDFMFGNDWQPGYYPWKLNVEKEIDYQVRRLRRHPSIVVWCGNNETEGAFQWNGRGALPADVRLRMMQDYVSTFNGLIARVVAHLAPEVPYWPSSPSSDYEDTNPDYQSGDMHNWNIWHGMEPLKAYENYFPRFMTEYGFQSFPEWRTVLAFTEPDDRTGITTPVMLAHQKNAAGNQKIHDYMLRDYPEPKDFPSFLYVSQVLQAEGIKIGAEHLRRNRPRTMGSIYWQLNDCWPVASWSSLDYFGRWKALHYFAKRFYQDVLVSPHEEDGNIAVYVVSDLTSPMTGELTVTLMKMDGTVLVTKKHAIEVPALSSNVYFSSPRTEYMNVPSADPADTFVVTELTSAGKPISSNVLYLLPPKTMKMVPAQIAGDLKQTGDGYRLTLSSKTLARSAYVSFGDLETTLSDNYFDLLPGKTVGVEIKSKATLDQLQKALQVMSLADAFAAPAGVAAASK